MPTKNSDTYARLGLGAWCSALLARILFQFATGDFAILYRPGARTLVRGRIPASKVGAIEEFFTRDFTVSRSVIVRGTFARGNRGKATALRLRFAGGLDPGRRQQVRNFLVNLLR